MIHMEPLSEWGPSDSGLCTKVMRVEWFIFCTPSCFCLGQIAALKRKTPPPHPSRVQIQMGKHTHIYHLPAKASSLAPWWQR